MKWISVKERLPDIDVNVLIYTPNEKCVQMACRINYGNTDYKGNTFVWFYPENNGWTEANVTHWMPLPNPPVEYQESPDPEITIWSIIDTWGTNPFKYFCDGCKEYFNEDQLMKDEFKKEIMHLVCGNRSKT